MLGKNSAVLFEPTADGRHSLMLFSPGKHIRNLAQLKSKARVHQVELSNHAAPVTLTGNAANIVALIRDVRR